MGKSQIPQQKGQKCQFLLGPSGSWFFPSNTDIWTQPKGSKENANLSYFIYGSIGCFCYGEIHHHSTHGTNIDGTQSSQANSTSATLNRLIDIKEDNLRVSCTRFLKAALRPLAMILTENGSFLIHDCMDDETLVHFRKSELIATFSTEPEMRHEETTNDHCSKRPRTDAMHQFSSCLWPSAQNAFIGISLPKKKTNLLFWLKLKDLTKIDNLESLQKNSFIESYEKLELDLPAPPIVNPICCMESVLLDPKTCLIAVAMDNGLIIVVKINFEQSKAQRVIHLARHGQQLCSLSFLFDDANKNFPLGLLASASRDGLVLVWDIENEFYFAYYSEGQSVGNGSHKSKHIRDGAKINWLALKFIPLKNSEQIHLAVSNSNNGLTVLKLNQPKKKPRSNIILLQETKEKYHKRQQGADQILRHHAILFNIVLDPMTQTLMTTSLDGTIILWKYHQTESSSICDSNDDEISLRIKPEYLYPTVSDNCRTHMMRHSPIREDFVALALGKGGVRFHKISENPKNYRFDMSSSCSEIACKIRKFKLSPTSVAWHPNHEYRLAIGTLEGKVLRVDLTPRRATMVETESRKPRRFRAPDRKVTGEASEDIFGVEYEPLERDDDDDVIIRIDDTRNSSKNSSEHNKTDGVYSLTWGPNPCCPQDTSKLAIYAIGSISHRLFIYENYSNKKENGEDKEKLTDYLDEFLDQSLPEAIGEASAVAWKSSMDLMALGTTTGKIIIVSYLDESHAERSRNNLFQKLVVIQGPLGTTYIQCLAWHPTADEDDPNYYYIAASASESPPYVFNIKESMLVADVKARLRIQEVNGSNSGRLTTMTNILSTYVHKLEGHKKSISDITWNPHKPNELATSSFDRYCFVWLIDDSSIEPMARVSAKFSARHRLFTVEWSLVDEDLIFTSGQDSTIWAWRPSGNRAKNELP